MAINADARGRRKVVRRPEPEPDRQHVEDAPPSPVASYPLAVLDTLGETLGEPARPAPAATRASPSPAGASPAATSEAPMPSKGKGKRGIRYDDAFKAKAVARMAAGKETVAAIADALGVKASTLYLWKKERRWKRPEKLSKVAPEEALAMVTITEHAAGAALLKALEGFIEARIKSGIADALRRGIG